MKPICKIVGCGKVSRTIGLCNAHHLKYVRFGNPLHGKSWRDKEFFLVWLKQQCTDDCIKWPFGVNDSGYGSAMYEGKHTSAQRWICSEINGKPPEDQYYEASHSCGKGHEGCVNPKHIRWLTRSENQLERAVHGTSNRGTRNGQSKLTEKAVETIYCSELDHSELAKIFGISRRTIRDIKNKKRWAWLTDAID